MLQLSSSFSSWVTRVAGILEPYPERCGLGHTLGQSLLWVCRLLYLGLWVLYGRRWDESEGLTHPKGNFLPFQFSFWQQKMPLSSACRGQLVANNHHTSIVALLLFLHSQPSCLWSSLLPLLKSYQRCGNCHINTTVSPHGLSIRRPPWLLR